MRWVPPSVNRQTLPLAPTLVTRDWPQCHPGQVEIRGRRHVGPARPHGDVAGLGGIGAGHVEDHRRGGGGQVGSTDTGDLQRDGAPGDRLVTAESDLAGGGPGLEDPLRHGAAVAGPGGEVTGEIGEEMGSLFGVHAHLAGSRHPGHDQIGTGPIGPG